jgi:predicted dehydrogenase
MNHRRRFLRNAALAGISLGFSESISAEISRIGQPFPTGLVPPGKRVGIIGLDTSHSTAFTKFLNAADSSPDYKGYKVVAAYPWGSRDIKTSYERIPEYTDIVKPLGVEIVDSISSLLSKVDVVLLETNDGKPHLQQALEVFRAGKPVFIDKPVAASLKDAVAIYSAAAKYNVPVFSSSSLRYTNGVVDILENKKAGNIIGADTFCPMNTEPGHPDLFWYGIHGVEYLYTVMGTGCRQVTRMFSDGNDVTVGVWKDGRIGTYRGLKKGQEDYGGTVFGDKGIVQMGTYTGYGLLLKKIVEFFESGKAPVPAGETLEIYAFMEAADESKRRKGAPVSLDEILSKAGG